MICADMYQHIYFLVVLGKRIIYLKMKLKLWIMANFMFNLVINRLINTQTT